MHRLVSRLCSRDTNTNTQRPALRFPPPIPLCLCVPIRAVGGSASIDPQKLVEDASSLSLSLSPFLPPPSRSLSISFSLCCRWQKWGGNTFDSSAAPQTRGRARARDARQQGRKEEREGGGGGGGGEEANHHVVAAIMKPTNSTKQQHNGFLKNNESHQKNTPEKNTTLYRCSPPPPYPHPTTPTERTKDTRTYTQRDLAPLPSKKDKRHPVLTRQKKPSPVGGGGGGGGGLRQQRKEITNANRDFFYCTRYLRERQATQEPRVSDISESASYFFSFLAHTAPCF